MRLKWIFVILFGAVIIVVATVIIILKTYDYNSLKPRINQASINATGRELILGGDIKIKIGLTPTLVFEDVRFQNVSWGSRPELAKVNSFEVRVALIPLIRRNIVVKRFILIGPDILVETDNTGRSNLAFETSPKGDKGEEMSGISRLPAVVFNEILIKDGIFTFKDGKSGAVNTISLEQVTANAQGFTTPVDLVIEGIYNKNPVIINGTLGALAALLDSEKPWTIDLKADAAGAVITAAGAVKDVMAQSGIDIDFSVKGKELGDMEKVLGKPLPVKGPYELSGHITDAGPKTYKVSNIKGALQDNELIGMIEIAFREGRGRPLLTADLFSKKLDLRSLVSKTEEQTDETYKGGVKTERVFSDEPFSLDVLKQVDVSAKVQTVEILMPKFAVNDLEVQATLKDGGLTIKPLKARVGEGIIEGNVSLKPKAKGHQLTIEMEVERLDLGRMLKSLEINDMLEGELDVSVSFSTFGASVAQSMAGLNGNISAIMSKGSIANKYINLIGSDLSSSILRLLNPGSQEGNNTEINCFVMRFDIKDGLLDTTALVFDTPFMTVVGEGGIDLKTEKLDISLKPSPKEGLRKGRIGKIALSLSELAKPFKLGGTLSKPSLAIDSTQAAITIGKAVGGATLFGPAGIAAALVSGSGGDENPCLAALDAAKTGVKVSDDKSLNKGKEIIENAAKDFIEKAKKNVLGESSGDKKKGLDGIDKEELKKGIEDFGKGIKGLFGK